MYPIFKYSLILRAIQLLLQEPHTKIYEAGADGTHLSEVSCTPKAGNVNYPHTGSAKGASTTDTMSEAFLHYCGYISDNIIYSAWDLQIKSTLVRYSYKIYTMRKYFSGKITQF